MGPLFWRMFAALWAGSALYMFGTAAMIVLSAGAKRPNILQDQFAPMVEAIAAGVLATEGDAGLQSLLVLQNINGTEIYLLDPRGRERFGRAVPTTDVPAHKADGSSDRLRLRVAGVVSDAAGTTYQVVALLTVPRPPAASTPRLRLLGPALISLLLAGLTSALVARYFVSPLATLRAATSRLGEGDLNSRIGGALNLRRDEFAALASDFDRMADGISNLVHSQRRLLLDLSHELRPPLARLRVALELSGVPSEAYPSLQSRMERDVERMDVLIGELLLLARIEWDGARPEFGPVEVCQLVEKIVDDERLPAVHTGHHLEYRGIASPLTVLGDRELLRRAVENIVRNVLQQTPAGTHILVDVVVVGAEVCINVSDRGLNIAPDSVERLFVSFARGEDSSSHGYALGLAISRGAVLQHGGRIETRTDTAGQGLEIAIYLPLSASDPA